MVDRNRYTTSGGVITLTDPYHLKDTTPRSFDPLSDGDIRLTETFPVFRDNNSNIINGIVVFDISENGWFITYCHTALINPIIHTDDSEKLKSKFDSLANYVSDFSLNNKNTLSGLTDIPKQVVEMGFDRYVEAIIKKYDAVLDDTPEMDWEEAVKLVNAIQDLNECEASDFYLEIFAPQGLLARGYSSYFLPDSVGNGYIDLEEPNRELLLLLKSAIELELPKYGLVTAYDNENNNANLRALQKRFGDGKSHASTPFIRHRRHRQHG